MDLGLGKDARESDRETTARNTSRACPRSNRPDAGGTSPALVRCRAASGSSDGWAAAGCLGRSGRRPRDGPTSRRGPSSRPARRASSARAWRRSCEGPPAQTGSIPARRPGPSSGTWARWIAQGHRSARKAAVFMSTKRANRSGAATAAPMPMPPPQSCATSVISRRSSVSMNCPRSATRWPRR